MRMMAKATYRFEELLEFLPPERVAPMDLGAVQHLPHYRLGLIGGEGPQGVVALSVESEDDEVRIDVATGIQQQVDEVLPDGQDQVELILLDGSLGRLWRWARRRHRHRSAAWVRPKSFTRPGDGGWT